MLLDMLTGSFKCLLDECARAWSHVHVARQNKLGWMGGQINMGNALLLGFQSSLLVMGCTGDFVGAFREDYSSFDCV